VQRAVSVLEEEFPGRIHAHNVDATTPESSAAVKALGFGNHGLVIRSSTGEVLWSQPDHEVDMAQVRTALQERLEDRPNGS